MWMKWIVATVPHSQRAAFSDSQDIWRVTAHCEGFLGQVGGWNTDGRACIVGLWRDAETYGRFMDHVHDPILRASSGPPAFTELDITTGGVLLQVGGGGGPVTERLKRARWLRVRDCTLHDDAKEAQMAHVLRERVPRLRETEGLEAALWSLVGAHRQQELTLWSEADAPAGPLPQVRRAARPDAPLAALQAHRVALVPAWRVLPA